VGGPVIEIEVAVRREYPALAMGQFSISRLIGTWPSRPRAVATADLLRRTICSQHRQSSTDYSGSTLVLTARCQALIAQSGQPGSDICSQGDYRADARDIKHLAHTGP
jgi:hypothetical protein